MLEVSISQAKSEFTKLLNQSVIIVDKKTKDKKAVLIPYEKYMNLLSKNEIKESLKDGIFSKFVGVLDKDFKTDDEKYQEIIK